MKSFLDVFLDLRTALLKGGTRIRVNYAICDCSDHLRSHAFKTGLRRAHEAGDFLDYFQPQVVGKHTLELTGRLAGFKDRRRNGPARTAEPRRGREAGGGRLGTGAVAPASRGNRARVDAEVRVVSAYAGGGGSPKASGTTGSRARSISVINRGRSRPR